MGNNERSKIVMSDDEIAGMESLQFDTQSGARPAESTPQSSGDIPDMGDLPLDCILEVKDKEQSVLRARERMASAILRSRPRSSVDRAAVS